MMEHTIELAVLVNTHSRGQRHRSKRFKLSKIKAVQPVKLHPQAQHRHGIEITLSDGYSYTVAWNDLLYLQLRGVAAKNRKGP